MSNSQTQLQRFLIAVVAGNPICHAGLVSALSEPGWGIDERDDRYWKGPANCPDGNLKEIVTEAVSTRRKDPK